MARQTLSHSPHSSQRLPFLICGSRSAKSTFPRSSPSDMSPWGSAGGYASGHDVSRPSTFSVPGPTSITGHHSRGSNSSNANRGSGSSSSLLPKASIATASTAAVVIVAHHRGAVGSAAKQQPKAAATAAAAATTTAAAAAATTTAAAGAVATAGKAVPVVGSAILSPRESCQTSTTATKEETEDVCASKEASKEALKEAFKEVFKEALKEALLDNDFWEDIKTRLTRKSPAALGAMAPAGKQTSNAEVQHVSNKLARRNSSL